MATTGGVNPQSHIHHPSPSSSKGQVPELPVTPPPLPSSNADLSSRQITIESPKIQLPFVTADNLQESAAILLRCKQQALNASEPEDALNLAAGIRTLERNLSENDPDLYMALVDEMCAIDKEDILVDYPRQFSQASELVILTNQLCEFNDAKGDNKIARANIIVQEDTLEKLKKVQIYLGEKTSTNEPENKERMEAPSNSSKILKRALEKSKNLDLDSLSNQVNQESSKELTSKALHTMISLGYLPKNKSQDKILELLSQIPELINDEKILTKLRMLDSSLINQLPIYILESANEIEKDIDSLFLPNGACQDIDEAIKLLYQLEALRSLLSKLPRIGDYQLQIHRREMSKRIAEIQQRINGHQKVVDELIEKLKQQLVLQKLDIYSSIVTDLSKIKLSDNEKAKIKELYTGDLFKSNVEDLYISIARSELQNRDQLLRDLESYFDENSLKQAIEIRLQKERESKKKLLNSMGTKAAELSSPKTGKWKNLKEVMAEFNRQIALWRKDIEPFEKLCANEFEASKAQIAAHEKALNDGVKRFLNEKMTLSLEQSNMLQEIENVVTGKKQKTFDLDMLYDTLVGLLIFRIKRKDPLDTGMKRAKEALIMIYDNAKKLGIPDVDGYLKMHCGENSIEEIEAVRKEIGK